MEKKQISRKLFWLLCILSFGLSTAFVILAKCYTLAWSDVTTADTVLPILLDYLSKIAEWCLYITAYAIIFYELYTEGVAPARKFIFVYAGSVFFKYLLNYLVTWITDAGMSSEYLADNLTYIGIYIGIEWLQLLFIMLMAVSSAKAYHKFLAGQRKLAATLPNYTLEERNYTFPFKKLFSTENVLQKNALWAGFVLTVFRVVSRMIYDITYGAPSDAADLMWMIFYYTVDIVVGMVSIIAITALFMRFDKMEQKSA